MLSLNVRNKNGKKEDYFAVMLQLNYDQEIHDKAKAFFSALYFELTVNFGFKFCDRIFYRVDTKDSISNLLNAAMRVIMLQQHLSKDELQKIIKHIFIIPLHEFDDVKDRVLN